MAFFKKNYGLIERLTITPTSGGTLTLANNSRTYQQLTGTTTHTVVLPQANAASPNECPVSLEFVIMNRSTGTVTVNYNGGSLAKSMATNTQATFRLVDNSTSAGTWDITNEASSGTGQATLSSLEKLSALSALGNDLYQDSETVTNQIKINPEEIGGNYFLSRAGLLTGRSRGLASNLNGFFYALGGSDGTNPPFSSIERFSDDSNYWLSRASFTTGLQNFEGFTTGSNILITGGFTDAALSTTSQVTKSYSDSSNAWTTKTSLPTVMNRAGGSYTNGLGYIFAGTTTNAGGGGVKITYAYSPTADAWYTRASTASQHQAPGQFRVDVGYIYDCAGFDSGGTAQSSVEFCIDSINAWYSTTAMSQAVSSPFSATGAGVGLVIGGFGASNYVDNNQQYNYASRIWVSSVILPVAGQGFNQASTVNGQTLCFGGDTITPASAVTTSNLYVPITFFQVPIVKKSNSVPASIFVAAALNGVVTNVPARLRSDGDNWKYITANVDSSLKFGESLSAKFTEWPTAYAVGGNDATSTNVRNTSEYYNSTNNTWTLISGTLSTARAAFAQFTLNATGYAVAGNTTGGANQLVVEKLNPITGTWSSAASLSTAKRNLGGASLNGFGYIAGGFTTVTITTAEKYDPTGNSWSSVSSLNTAKSHGTPFVLGSNFYYAGGTTTNASANSTTGVEMFNDAVGTWVTTPGSLSIATNSGGGSVSNGFGYLVGGATSSSVVNTVFKFNIGTNSWSTVASLNSSQVAEPAVMRSDQNIMRAGGYDNSGTPLSGSEQYNDAANTWTNKTGLSITRAFCGYGACTPNQYRNYELQIGVPTYLSALGSYQFVSRANSNNNHSSGGGQGHMDGKTYVLNNASGGNRNSEFYNHDLNSWTNWIPSPVSPSGGTGSFVLGGLTYHFNGPASVTYVANPFLNTFTNKSASTANTRFRVLQPSGNPLNGFGYWYGGDQDR